MEGRYAQSCDLRPPFSRSLHRSPGYDLEGANDLKHRLVGTRKWIGTAELHVAFLTRGIPSRLVEFPDVTSDGAKVLKWIEEYFSSEAHEGRHFRGHVQKTVDEVLRGASPVVVTDRMPIILQHQGHSRTIVGYERRKDGSVNLICFDPSRKPSKEVRNAAVSRFWSASGIVPSSPSTSLSQRHNLAASKLFNKILHPHGDRENRKISGEKKRRASDNFERDSEPKRVRGGLLNSEGTVTVLDNDDEVHIVESPGSQRSVIHHRPAVIQLSENELMKMLDSFRLKPARIG